MRKGTGIMKTPKPLLALRMVFPLAASLIVLLLGEGIARGSLSADVFASFIFPHIGAYLLAWLLLFLVWLLLDWVFRCPPLPGRHIAQGVGRLKNPGPHLRCDGDVVVLIQNPGDSCGRDLGSLSHIFDRRHEIPPSQVLLSLLYFSPVRSQ